RISRLKQAFIASWFLDNPIDNSSDAAERHLNAWRLKLLRTELIRFKIASMALVAIGVTTLIVVGSLAARQSLAKEQAWVLLALLGFSAVCLAVPLIKSVAIGRDRAGFELAGPIEKIEAALKVEREKAEAARNTLLGTIDQQIAALSVQITEIDNGLVKLLEAGGMVSSASDVKEPSLRDIRKRLPDPTNEDDPQKGKFGREESANGRQLTAKTRSSPLSQGWLTVILRVTVTNRQPLAGQHVYFFLHDTFEPDAYRAKVDKSGMFAELEIQATGAFTAGAVAD